MTNENRERRSNVIHEWPEKSKNMEDCFHMKIKHDCSSFIGENR